ncbi:unnamed protein product [Penicillium salamii]|nr:unnamed protein product [Penicillium salamii]
MIILDAEHHTSAMNEDIGHNYFLPFGEDFPWGNFSDNTLSPVLRAPGHDIFPVLAWRNQLPTNGIKTVLPFVDCYYFSGYSGQHSFRRMGPDVLSDSISSEDIFLFSSFLSPVNEVYRLEILFTVLDKSTRGVLGEKSFLLHRWLGSLARIRQEILSNLGYLNAYGLGSFYFEIHLSPGRDSTCLEPMAGISPFMQNLPIDPMAFVQNIIGNFL